MHLPRKRTGFKRRALVIAAITTVVAGVLVLFGVQSVQRIRAVEDRWVVYSQDAAEASRLLYEVSQQMGYGGYIHNFKNFILRRDIDVLATLADNSEAVYVNLDQLGRHAISEEEEMAIGAIRKVIDAYVASVPVAVDAFKRGLSSVEVDIMVKVDDQPALTGIAELNHSILTRTRLAEREINKTVGAATFMVWVLLAMAPVVVMLGVFQFSGALFQFSRALLDAHFQFAMRFFEFLFRAFAFRHIAHDGGGDALAAGH